MNKSEIEWPAFEPLRALIFEKIGDPKAIDSLCRALVDSGKKAMPFITTFNMLLGLLIKVVKLQALIRSIFCQLLKVMVISLIVFFYFWAYNLI